MVPVTAFFAGALALLFIALSVYVIRNRYTLRLPIGHGGDVPMERRIRAHANFAEYVPLALVLMAVNELNGMPQGYLALLGGLLAAGRVFHAYSILVAETRSRPRILFRQTGMGATLTVIAILALAAIF